MNDIAAFIADVTELLGPNCVFTDPATRTASSRDYAWLSPILTEELPTTVADVVVRPSTALAIAPVLALAHRHGVQVTPRGRGTGNYGQAVPLDGGVVVDLSGCTAIVEITDGIAHVEAGVTFTQLEAEAARYDLEVMVMPSLMASTVGGFLAGGNQGIGSIENGSIWDGWVAQLRVVPCVDAPTSFVVSGPELESYLHSYGTTGVIAEAWIHLTLKRERTVLFAAFASFGDAARAGRALMDLEPAPRVLSIDDPALSVTLPQHAGLVPGATMLRAGVEVGTVDAASAIIAEHGGRTTAVDPSALPSVYASVYNHATLRSKRVDASTCALQVRGWALIDHEDDVRAALPDVRLHLDGNAPRVHGRGYSGLLLSRWVDRDTLQRGMDRLRDLGVNVISPHTWVLGGHGNVDRLRRVTPVVDPDGLMNRGKLPESSGSAA